MADPPTGPIYLFLGGEFNGQKRAVPNDEQVFRVFANPIPGVHGTQGTPEGVLVEAPLPSGNGHGAITLGAPKIAQAWIRRVLTATGDDGRVWQNVVYIHESITGPQDMFAVLANYLILSWAIQGGEAVPNSAS